MNRIVTGAIVFASITAAPVTAQDAMPAQAGEPPVIVPAAAPQVPAPDVSAAAPAVEAVAAPIVAPLRPDASTGSLPANTEVMLAMAETINTREHEEGYMFRLTVRHDVLLDDHVVIPAGTPAFGEITWRTGRGMFGKSGKMDVELRYIDMNGRRIPVTGSYRQEGEGNTAATIAGVVVIPVAGLFITGRSGVIPEGRELAARTAQALPVNFSAAVHVPAAAPAEERAEVDPELEGGECRLREGCLQ